MSPNRIVGFSSLSSGSTSRPSSPSGITGYPINYSAPQDSHSLQGMYGAMALHSFDQFNKTTDHTSRYVTGYLSCPEFFHSTSGCRMESSSPHPKRHSSFLPSKWEAIPHIPKKFQPLPRCNLRYIQKL